MSIRKNDTVLFDKPPIICGWAAAGGKKESEGPLRAGFDVLYTDNYLGKESWEMAECELARSALEHALRKAGVRASRLCAVLAGDLQCQCTASSYLMRGIDVPMLGLYGACSTGTEGIGLAACLAHSGAVPLSAVCVSSHFCSAERQFRTPLDYGGKRTPCAQWTVTAAGALIVGAASAMPLPQIHAVTFGRVRDYSIKDINNMGAAMAPAACETLLHYFADTGTQPCDFDAIYTGDLGAIGSKLLYELLRKEGIVLENHHDCGLLVYDAGTQQVGAGGSGAGCCMSVLCSHILPMLADGRLGRCLVMATGALMSQITALQKESIPAIAHLIELRAPQREETA